MKKCEAWSWRMARAAFGDDSWWHSSTYEIHLLHCDQFNLLYFRVREPPTLVFLKAGIHTACTFSFSRWHPNIHNSSYNHCSTGYWSQTHASLKGIFDVNIVITKELVSHWLNISSPFQRIWRYSTLKKKKKKWVFSYNLRSKLLFLI